MTTSKKDKKNPKAKKVTLKSQAEEQRKAPALGWGKNHNETLVQ